MKTFFSLVGILSALQTFGAIGGVIGGGTFPPSKQIWVAPGANLYATKQAVAGSSLLVVGPGLYGVGVTNLFDNKFTKWLFLPGAVVSNNNVNGLSMWDNSGTGYSGACSNEVYGDGTFIDMTDPTIAVTRPACVLITNSLSNIKFQCKRIVTGGINYSSGVYVQDCFQTWLDIDWIDGPSTSYCFWWDNGNVEGRIGRMTAKDGTSIYGRGDKAADCYLNVDYIACTNNNWLDFVPTASGNKLWLKGLAEGWGDTLTGGNLNVGGGKFYCTGFQKIWSPGTYLAAQINQTGGEVWLEGSKVTTTNAAPWFQQSGGWNEIKVSHWEDAGAGGNTRPYNFLLTGGTNNLLGPSVALSKWGPGYKITAGEAYITGLKLNTFTTLSHSNAPLWITGGTPTLDSCILISGSHFSVTSAAAADLRIFGTLSLKSNLAATITTRVGSTNLNGTFVDR